MPKDQQTKESHWQVSVQFDIIYEEERMSERNSRNKVVLYPTLVSAI